MIEIDDKVISIELFRRKYCCDLSKCKGECCYEGDSGAPLEEEETEILDKIYNIIKPDLTEKAIKEIETNGKWIIDNDGDKVTPIINGKECVYTYRDKDGTWKCAIEKAFNEGKIDWKKPISCHLYPIRTQKYKTFEAVNFHEWDVCKAAVELGESIGLPVYKFLKEPIIRKWGEDFYEALEEVAPEVEKEIERRKR